MIFTHIFVTITSLICLANGEIGSVQKSEQILFLISSNFHISTLSTLMNMTTHEKQPNLFVLKNASISFCLCTHVLCRLSSKYAFPRHCFRIRLFVQYRRLYIVVAPVVLFKSMLTADFSRVGYDAEEVIPHGPSV